MATAGFDVKLGVKDQELVRRALRDMGGDGSKPSRTGFNQKKRNR